jgi:replicative DNA helicase
MKPQTVNTLELLDRQPPCDVQAEKGVLGSIFLDSSKADDVAGVLKADDFYDDANRRLYATFLRMRDAGKRIDMTLLVGALRASGDWEHVGASYLGEIAHAVPVAAHAIDYAETVLERSMRRRMIHAATRMLRAGYDVTVPIADSITVAEKGLGEITTGACDGGPVPMSVAIPEALDHATRASRGEQLGVATGFPCVDSVTGGFFRKELSIIAARPSIGKTALAIQVADYIAERRDVYFASLEMSRAELATRILCRRGNVDSSGIRRAKLSQEDLGSLVEAGNAVYGSRLWLDDRATMTVRDIRRAATRIASKGNLAAVFVDYLQLVTPNDERKNRYEQIGDICRGLKALAKELDCAVVALCQLNRLADGEIPRLIHLRESGSQEQDGDCIMALVNNVAYGNDDQPAPDKSAVIVLKQRNGPLATCPLRWTKELTMFEDPNVGQREEAFDKYAF